MMNVVRISAGIATAVLLSAAMPAQAEYSKADGNTIVDVAKEAGSFETLLTAAKAAGLAETLMGEGPFTVFAPTDEAFEKLPEGVIPALLEDTEKLKSILLFHVVKGEVMAEKAVTLDSAPTVFGQPAPIEVKDGKAYIAGAEIVQTDIEASNGVIHVIDSVMMPKDIVGVAAANESFSTLVTAVTEAGLVETLQGEGPFTVFAPTNEAFAALPEGTLEAVLADKDKLTAILTYHVVPGKVTAADVVGVDEAPTVQGDTITVTVEDDTVMVDNAKVVVTDIMATNGVIHVIDAVIMPDMDAKTAGY